MLTESSCYCGSLLTVTDLIKVLSVTMLIEYFDVLTVDLFEVFKMIFVLAIALSRFSFLLYFSFGSIYFSRCIHTFFEIIWSLLR